MAGVIVGMSGGVDSTAALIRLKELGHEVTGVTLKLWGDASKCCDYDDVMAAKKACGKLGVRHYVLNMKRGFKKYVTDYFINEYLSGRTPNPCAVCNEKIKFHALLKKADELGCDFAATGHYAVIEKKGRSFVLKKGKDTKKSQEYFLARLPKKHLSKIILPLGKMTKQQAREKVKEYGFDYGKKESQEVCFLKDSETPYEFIIKHRKSAEKLKGGLYDTSGRRLKTLDKAYFKYTVGQRKGLNYSAGKPLYVARIDPENKAVIAGSGREAGKREFAVTDVNLLQKIRLKKFRARVKIRYGQAPFKAGIKISADKWEVAADESQFAVTPGQLAVFYDNDTVIGSGYIE